MVNKINVVENTFRLQNKKIGFNAFCNLLNEIQNKDMYESKYLFLMYYCRAKWKIFYIYSIIYTDPIYTIKEYMNINPWLIFLEAFENNKYYFLN